MNRRQPDELVYIAFRGPRALRDLAKRAALDQGRTLKQLLHDALTEYLRNRGYDPDRYHPRSTDT